MFLGARKGAVPCLFVSLLPAGGQQTWEPSESVTAAPDFQMFYIRVLEFVQTVNPFILLGEQKIKGEQIGGNVFRIYDLGCD